MKWIWTSMYCGRSDSLWLFLYFPIGLNFLVLHFLKPRDFYMSTCSIIRIYAFFLRHFICFVSFLQYTAIILHIISVRSVCVIMTY